MEICDKIYRINWILYLSLPWKCHKASYVTRHANYKMKIIWQIATGGL